MRVTVSPRAATALSSAHARLDDSQITASRGMRASWLSKPIPERPSSPLTRIAVTSQVRVPSTPRQAPTEDSHSMLPGLTA
jgi:hypothetical protein